MSSIVLSKNRLSSLLHGFLLFSLCLAFFTGCSSPDIIVNNLDEREANEILVYLSTKGINAEKKENTSGSKQGGGTKVTLWDIYVPVNKSREAMSLLNQVGLPRRRSQNLLNIFGTSGLVPSEMEQQIKYQAGLAEQIGNTIRKIDGVLDAEVQLSFPKEDPLNPTLEKKSRITASVYVKHNGVLDDPNSHLSTKIKRLVAASVPGLDYDYVTVIGERTRFNELSSYGGTNVEEEKHLVNVWSITVAKSSLTRFRVVFFTFTLLLLMETLIIVWILWKMHLVLQQSGGVKELFTLKPLALEKKSETDELQSDKAIDHEAGDGDEENSDHIDKDVDHT